MAAHANQFPAVKSGTSLVHRQVHASAPEHIVAGTVLQHQGSMVVESNTTYNQVSPASTDSLANLVHIAGVAAEDWSRSRAGAQAPIAVAIKGTVVELPTAITDRTTIGFLQRMDITGTYVEAYTPSEIDEPTLMIGELLDLLPNGRALVRIDTLNSSRDSV